MNNIKNSSSKFKCITPKAVLFDLDDTLTDRIQSLSAFTYRFSEDFANHLSPVDYVTLNNALLRSAGKGYRSKEEIFLDLVNLLSWQSIPTVEEFVLYWEGVFPQCTIGRPGLHQILQTLKKAGIKLGIVTNGRTAGKNAKIDVLGIRDYMSTVVISQAVQIQKPDPLIFRLAVNALQVAPADVCYVGDHPANDILGAEAAGLIPIWLRGQHPWEEGLPPQFQISTLSDIVSLVTDISVVLNKGKVYATKQINRHSAMIPY